MMNHRQFEIAQRLREITAEVDRLAQEQNLWQIQQMAYMTMVPSDEIAYRDWDALIRALTDEAKALRDEFPSAAENEAFIKRFGRHAYGVYSELFPINAQTIIADVPTDFINVGYRYAVPRPMSWGVPSEVSPVYEPLETKTAEFHWFATGTGQVYLAYAPEINTVFVASKR